MPLKKILIVDSEKSVSDNLKTFFEKEGFSAKAEYNADDALKRLNIISPDILILDTAFAGTDVLQICLEIRRRSDIPIILMSGKDDLFDKILGFEFGADDYMIKPFDPRELLARIRAIARRIGKRPAEVENKEIEYDNLSINLTKYILTVAGNVIDAPPKEIELLYHLASHPNRVFNREEILDTVWGFDYFGDSRTIDVHIKRLRTKLDGVSEQWSLKTVWGVGYKFQVDGVPVNTMKQIKNMYNL